MQQYMKVDLSTEKAYMEECEKQKDRLREKLLEILGDHRKNHGAYKSGYENNGIVFMPEMVNFKFTGHYFSIENPYMKFTAEYMNAHPEMFEKIK